VVKEWWLSGPWKGKFFPRISTSRDGESSDHGWPVGCGKDVGDASSMIQVLVGHQPVGSITIGDKDVSRSLEPVGGNAR